MGGKRFMFAVPQNGWSLLGTWYGVVREDRPAVTPEEGARLLVEEFNHACPRLQLSDREIMGQQWGWLPLRDSGAAPTLADRPRIIDYGKAGGARRLLSVEGVKYTTARGVAQRIVNWVYRELGQPAPPCRTDQVLLTVSRTQDTGIRGAVHRAVHEEMALKLSDVLRRTSPGITAPSRSIVAEAAALAGAELGWDALRQEAEIEDVMRRATVRPSEEPVG
jgi:glycerol-3-phosphate dehydrogenase